MAATLVRTAGPRLLNLIAKRAAEAKPVGFLSAAKEAAGFKTAGEAVARLAPEVFFGTLSALGPGGVAAVPIDILSGAFGSYGGEVGGAGVGGLIANLRGLKGAKAQGTVNTFRTIGAFAGNAVPMFVPNPVRNNAIRREQELYNQQLLAQAGMDTSGAQMLSPEMRPSSQSLLDQEIDRLGAAYGVADSRDPMTRYLLAQMLPKQ